MLDMIKRQLTSGDTERTYMPVQTIYLTLQVMGKINPARKQIIDLMVHTTLAAHYGNDARHLTICDVVEGNDDSYNGNNEDVLRAKLTA